MSRLKRSIAPAILALTIPAAAASQTAIMGSVSAQRGSLSGNDVDVKSAGVAVDHVVGKGIGFSIEARKGNTYGYWDSGIDFLGNYRRKIMANLSVKAEGGVEFLLAGNDYNMTYHGYEGDRLVEQRWWTLNAGEGKTGLGKHAIAGVHLNYSPLSHLVLEAGVRTHIMPYKIYSNRFDNDGNAFNVSIKSKIGLLPEFIVKAGYKF